jgi:hypothetical protein
MVYPHLRHRRITGTGLYDYYGFICRPPSHHGSRLRLAWGLTAVPLTQNRAISASAAKRQAVLVYADETGWKKHGRRVWLLVFVVGRRTQEAVVSVLGEQFANWLMSDGYWAYRHYDWRLRCLAHLTRKARGLEPSFDADGCGPQRFHDTNGLSVAR